MTGWSMLLWKRGEPRNSTTTPRSASTCWRSSRTRRLLPMPGSPLITASWPTPPVVTCHRWSEHSQLGIPPDERCQPPTAHGVEAVLHIGLADHGERRQCAVHALEQWGPERLDLEEPLDEGEHAAADDDLVGIGEGLQTRRNVRSLADDVSAAP